MDKINYISPLLFDLGNHIKLIRKLKGITQTELANNCDMEKSSISKIESGQTNVGYLSLVRISNGLDVTMCELTRTR